MKQFVLIGAAALMFFLTGVPASAQHHRGHGGYHHGGGYYGHGGHYYGGHHGRYGSHYGGYYGPSYYGGFSPFGSSPYSVGSYYSYPGSYGGYYGPSISVFAAPLSPQYSPAYGYSGCPY